MAILSDTSGPGIKGVALYDSHTNTPIRMSQINGVTRVPTSAVLVDSSGNTLTSTTTPAQTDPGIVVRPVPSNFEMDVKKGLVTGHTSFDKWGRLNNIDTTTGIVPPIDVWNGATIYTGFPTGAAETIEVFSADNNDGAGTNAGLLSLRLFGLDASGVEQEVDVDLNGTTPVPTTETWTRMPRMRGLTAGSNDFNLGAITARHTTTPANIFAVMPVNTNRTHIACWTIPAAKTAYLKKISWHMTRASGAAGSATVALMCRGNGGVWEQTLSTDISTGSTPPLELDYGTSFAALTDLSIRVIDVSDNDTSVSAIITGIYVDD